MNCKRLKINLWLWGRVLLCCGFAVGAARFSATATVSDPELESLLRSVESRYNHVKTLRMRFEQTYAQDRRVLRQESGMLYLRKPGEMRWEYESPEPKLFLTDGHTLTLYVPQDKRVTETAVKKSDDLRSPMRFLLGGLHFEKEFQQFERVTDAALLDAQDTMIKLVPKHMQGGGLEWVMMEIGPEYEIRRLILQEVGGIQNEFVFSDETFDLRLAPQLFEFSPPPGAQVIHQ